MKNKKKTIIISAIGLVLLVAVIVSVVVMKQSGQKAAKEPDKSEQTATDPTSVDDEKAVEDELPVVPIQAEDAVSGGQSGDSAIGNNGKKDSPSTSGTNGKQDSPSTSGTNGKKDSPSTSGANGKQNGQSSSGSGGKKTDEPPTTTENATTEKTTTESTTTEQNTTEQPTTKPDDSGAIELPFVPAE